MRLHHHPLSPYSRKAYSAVLHRGDEMDFTVVDVRGGGLATPEFRALSPFGKMPVLETDTDGTIIESTSIIEYLEARGPRSLLPQGSERVARYFDRLGDLYLIDPAAAMWRTPRTEEATSAPATARAAWALFSRQLEGRPFVCGAQFSIADLAASIATDYLQRLGQDPPSDIRAWRDRCFEVPAMARALEEAMPFIERSLGSRSPHTRS